MVPYQVYKVLAGQRVHDRVAPANRHVQVAASTHEVSHAHKLSARVKDVAKRTLTAFHARREAGVGPIGTGASVATRASASTPMTGPGPIGCSA